MLERLLAAVALVVVPLDPLEFLLLFADLRNVALLYGLSGE